MAASTDSAEVAKPVGLVVTVEVKAERLADFLKIIETHAVESRKEAGCLSFDVLQDPKQETKFVFYELYASAAAVASHNETPHYKATGAALNDGVVASLSIETLNGIFTTPVA